MAMALHSDAGGQSCDGAAHQHGAATLVDGTSTLKRFPQFAGNAIELYSQRLFRGT